jgi:hypothetical protein
MESCIDRVGKMKDDPGTSHVLCVPDLVPRKKIPKHHPLALELHENSLPRRFHQRYSKVKKNMNVKKCSTSKLKKMLNYISMLHTMSLRFRRQSLSLVVVTFSPSSSALIRK